MGVGLVAGGSEGAGPVACVCEACCWTRAVLAAWHVCDCESEQRWSASRKAPIVIDCSLMTMSGKWCWA